MDRDNKIVNPILKINMNDEVLKNNDNYSNNHSNNYSTDDSYEGHRENRVRTNRNKRGKRSSKSSKGGNRNKRISSEEMNKKKKNIKIVFFVIVLLILIFVVATILNRNIVVGKNKKTNLVINNNNITSDLRHDVLIEDDILYVSKADIENFFDPYIYNEKETNKIITTYDKKCAAIGFEKNEIFINGANKSIAAKAIEKDSNIYLPISEMKDVYNIEINYNDKSKVVTMDSLNREQKKAIVTSNLPVRSSKGYFAKTIDKVKKGESVIVVSDNGKFAKIRTDNGKIGYIKSNKLQNEFVVREAMEDEKQIKGKVNLTWEYFSQYGKAPNRNGTKIDGINVVSPAFFYLAKDGSVKENVGQEGVEYIDWAHNNGYKVWPMVSNAEVATSSLDFTSDIMNSYLNRELLIDNILDKCVKYNLDGINIDFENMRKSDKDMFSRFIIELAPRMKEAGFVLSVDVTAPDGGETWSLCYDRHIIGDVADYIVFMAYDQYGNSSKKAGTTAGYDWVKLNLDKFLRQEDVKPEKIILGIPFYNRMWTTNENYDVKSYTVSMKKMNTVIPDGVKPEWNDKLKQNYIKFKEGSDTKEMWIEDLKSLQAKVSLVNEYKLAGIGSWRKDFETPDVWGMLKQELSKDSNSSDANDKN